jgi:hypothetical protein
LFAVDDIDAGEIVAVKGGSVMSFSRFKEIEHLVSPTEIQIEDDLVIASEREEDVESNILCLNHSCSPNVGVRGQITFVALRCIPVGHELTIDYAMIDGDPNERMDCECGSVECRGVVTGSDWQREDLQRRYAGHFSSYLQDRIDNARRRPAS